MPLNYIVNFGDRDGTLYRIEIDNPDYSDNPIELIPSETPLILSWEGNNDDDIFKTHVIPSSITIGVVSTGLDFDTLFYINDASFKTRVYRSDELYWSGYLISDGIQESDSGVPFDVNLSAIDGLQLLENTPLLWNNYSNGRINIGGVLNDQRAPINAFRVALYGTSNLDNRLPIRWNTSLKNDTRPTSDMIAGLTVINARGDLSSLNYSNYLWLENLCKSAQSWLYQRNGRWYINRYFDTNGYEITTDVTTEQTPLSVVVNDVFDVLPQDTINESWYWFGKKPLGGVSITYDSSTFNNENNVVPDGDFINRFLGGFTYWYMKDSNALISPEETITDRNDSLSAEILNLSDEGDYLTFGKVPIDTDILYKTCQIGLKWLPLGGYELTPEGNIDFTKYPIHISVKLTIGVNEYYLNEFGYWSDKNAEPNAQVTQSQYDPIYGWYNVAFDPSKNFFPGDEVVIRVLRSGGRESYRIIFTETMDVQSGTDHISSLIPNSSTPNNWTIQINSVIYSPANIGYITKSDNYYRELQLNAGDNFKINDVIDFQFVSRGGSGDIKMPSGKGFLSFDIWSKPNSSMRIAEVFFRVPDNKDIYDISSFSSKNSKDSYSMGISSGWSGNQVSSYGNSYETTDESELWNGGKTLTQLYGEAIMNVRNRPNRVFSGTIDRQMEWSMFSLMGHVYAPLSMRVNIKDKTTELVGVEFAPSSPVGGYVVDHKSSGDN